MKERGITFNKIVERLTPDVFISEIGHYALAPPNYHKSVIILDTLAGWRGMRKEIFQM